MPLAVNSPTACTPSQAFENADTSIGQSPDLGGLFASASRTHCVMVPRKPFLPMQGKQDKSRLCHAADSRTVRRGLTL